MKLANKLKEARVAKNMTQADLADKVGVTRQTIIAIEKEKFIPSAKLALEITRALEINFDQVFWLE